MPICPDAIQRVTARGNARQDIVADGVDRDKWVDLLKRTLAAEGWRLFAFSLMTSHYHAFLHTPEANLSKGMRHLNGSIGQGDRRGVGGDAGRLPNSSLINTSPYLPRTRCMPFGAVIKKRRRIP